MHKSAVCGWCRIEFEYRFVPSEPERGQFCSLRCFHKHNTKYPLTPVECGGCGVSFTPNKTQVRALAVGEQKMVYCTPECYRAHLNTKRRADGNPHWKGGTIESYGYRYRRMKDRHRVSPYVAEHQLVAEAKISRPLLPGEIVHHINGNRQDNRPENLEVMTISEHMKLHARERAERRLAQDGI